MSNDGLRRELEETRQRAGDAEERADHRKKVLYGIAPGASAELRSHGNDLLAQLPEVDPSSCRHRAVIIGMRADASGHIVPGTRDDYVCSRCSARVRLAPSGQRLAEGGMAVLCIECLPAWEAELP
jgi:hypothetical protein